MAKRDVEFIIDENGDLTMEIKGMKGTSCSVEMDKLLKQLGHAPAEVVKTAEYYQGPNIHLRTNQ